MGGVTYTYDGKGRRTSKNNVTYTYDSKDRLIAGNAFEFYYDDNGLTGFVYCGCLYYYQRDMQGNIIAILDSNGNLIVKYRYDAWGNHKVLDASGNVITSASHIGNVNPFRYRGYFYDIETGLYYLKTRYYDPVTGRFLNMDSIGYADPETINGLNLYAYCNNNPVMAIDPNGHFSILTSILAALIIAFVVDTVTETAILLNDEQYKAENVANYDENGNVDNVHINNSAMFNNPIAQLVYSKYLYENVKNSDGSHYFKGDVYDIVGEWQAHNFAAVVTGIGMVAFAPLSILLSNGGDLMSHIFTLHKRSISVDLGESLSSDERLSVRIFSSVFKWNSKIGTFNILNWW